MWWHDRFTALQPVAVHNGLSQLCPQRTAGCKAGLLEEVDWKREVKQDAHYVFGNRYGKAWWWESLAVVIADNAAGGVSDLVVHLPRNLLRNDYNPTK